LAPPEVDVVAAPPQELSDLPLEVKKRQIVETDASPAVLLFQNLKEFVHLLVAVLRQRLDRESREGAKVLRALDRRGDGPVGLGAGFGLGASKRSGAPAYQVGG
jgi:hypothetical protein